MNKIWNNQSKLFFLSLQVFAFLEEVDKFDGKPTNMKELTCRAVSNVICNCLLGKRFEYTDAYYLEFLKMFDDAVGWPV